MKCEAVLFDLDGTLADTAPDLGQALNQLRAQEGLPPLDPAALRPYTSAGTRGMLRVGFDLTPASEAYPALARRFLDLYEAGLCVHTHVFPELVAVLEHLEAQSIAWGVVTNKPRRYTEPLMAALGLSLRCACIVSGDSAERPKPAPDPLLLAARLTGRSAERTLYVGDDLRDIQSGHAAGMRTAAAGWGYLGVDTPIDTWAADWIAQSPTDLLPIIAGPWPAHGKMITS